MKVCTDSCVFGAWIADKMSGNPIENILDIGTGTGLLSLMIAQKSSGKIVAIELDKNAAVQAFENFQASPWARRITAVQADIKSWSAPVEFDLIVSNPPFFDNHLLPEDLGKMNSKHGSQLTLPDLTNEAIKMIKKTGHFAVLLPFERLEEFQQIARESGLFVKRRLLLRQSVKHSFFRAILLLAKSEQQVIEEELVIRNVHGLYTEDFAALMKDYYLK